MLTSSFSIPYFLVASFLLLNLGVGLASRKATTFRAYAVDNKGFSTVKLLATLLATSFCGVVLVSPVQVCYSYGLLQFCLMFVNAIALWLTSLAWVRMAPFMHHLSIAETIGSVYGNYPRIITALLSIWYTISTLIFQINAISYIVTVCLHSVDPNSMIVLAALVIITYAAFGGIRSVTNTDVLQFIIFIIIIIIVAKLMFVKTGKSFLEIIWFARKQEKFKLSSLCYPDGHLWDCIVYFLFCLLSIVDPAIIQRMYMCSGPIQVKKVFLYGSFLYALIMLFICLIGLFVFSSNSTLSMEEIWGYIVTSLPSFLQGAIITCVLAMATSTADSYLHLCSIIVAHDLMESIPGVKPIVDRLQIRVARLAILGIGLFSMVMAIYSNDLWKSFSSIVFYVYTLYGVVVAAPFILACFGFRGSARTALIGMAMAILMSLACKKFRFLIGIPACVASMVANGLNMMAAHYLLPQPPGMGWIGLNPQQKRLKQLVGLFKRFNKRAELE